MKSGDAITVTTNTTGTGQFAWATVWAPNATSP